MTDVVRARCRDHLGDERSLRVGLLADLRSRVPFRFHVWVLVDPETEVATAPLATLPEPLTAQLPGIIRRRYLTPLNRWDTMIARTRPPSRTWLTFRAARIEDHRPGDGRDIAVTITASTPAERRSLYVRAHGLSHREIDVVELLAEGADTRKISAALFVSEHTVQDHLKSVFDKTGTRNRRTLLARLTGN